MAVFLILYVLSMAPVGRLYTSWRPGTLPTSPHSHGAWTWHEGVVESIYSPLLFITSRNRAVYRAQVAWSNCWAPLIPLGRTTSEAYRYEVMHATWWAVKRADYEYLYEPEQELSEAHALPDDAH